MPAPGRSRPLRVLGERGRERNGDVGRSASRLGGAARRRGHAANGCRVPHGPRRSAGERDHETGEERRRHTEECQVAMNGRDHGVRMTGRGLLVLSLTACARLRATAAAGEGMPGRRRTGRAAGHHGAHGGLARGCSPASASDSSPTRPGSMPGASPTWTCSSGTRARRRGRHAGADLLAGARHPRHGGPHRPAGCARRAVGADGAFAVPARDDAPAGQPAADLDALVFDLQDIGTRTWTYVGVMVYAMRAAARSGIPFIVLDRPNPLGGRMDGPLLDAALANSRGPHAGAARTGYALWPARCGMV
jgi:hypothetical protein